MRYLAGELSSDESIGKFYNPSLAESFAKVEGICDKAEAAVKAHYDMPTRVETVSVRLIERHIAYCRRLAKAMIFKCQGMDAEAKEAFDKLWEDFNLYELDMEANYDHSLCMWTLSTAMGAKTNLPTKDEEPLLNLDLK